MRGYGIMNYLYCMSTLCVLLFVCLGCKSNDGPMDSLRSGGKDHAQELPITTERDRDSRQSKLAGDVADINRIEPGWGTPLYMAAFDLDVDAVRYLLSIGADVNKGDEDGYTPLHVATEKESEEAIEIIKVLLSHGADVNAKVKSKGLSAGTVNLAEGRTPLHNAASVSIPGKDFGEHSNIGAVELLLDHGADVNARDAWGCTPLSHSLFPGFLDIMELLVEHGTDLNIQNDIDGGTVLHDAASNGDLQAVKLFVSHGADIDARDFEGETPLHKAALIRSQDTVDYLVSHGADLHARSKRGETPQDFLDEPRCQEPILLSGHDEYPFSLIVMNGLTVRRELQLEQIEYDTVWFPSESDVERLGLSLRKWLEDHAPQADTGPIAPDRILSHFDQFNREYAGFIKDGTKYIYGNMAQISTDPVLRSLPGNSFSGVHEVGHIRMTVVFDATSKEIISLTCDEL